MPKSQHSDAYAQAVDLLIQARHKAGLTQVELAEALGKPQPFISKVERRVRRLDVVEFCLIARALGVDPAKLVSALVRQLPHDIEI